MQLAHKYDPVVVDIPCTVRVMVKGGKRMVAVEASCEAKDSEGDIILQKALLDSAASFIRSGDLDIDHLSKIGDRVGAKDPMPSYIVGEPTEVNDIGGGRTEVIGFLYPENPKSDWLWSKLQSEPDRWRSSIYGFPTDMDEGTGGASRYLVKAMDWTSLAFTRNPVNDAIKGHARIIKANAFMSELVKCGITCEKGMPEGMINNSWESATLNQLYERYLAHRAEGCDLLKSHRTTYHIQKHMEVCEGMPLEKAEIVAHAIANLVKRSIKHGY